MSAPISGGSNLPGPFAPTPFPTQIGVSGPIFGFAPGHGRPHIGIPLMHPNGQVQGYALLDQQPADDDPVARATAKFQAFYDALAPDEQEIIELLLERAASASA